MTVYRVPIVGFIVAAQEHRKAVNSDLTCLDKHQGPCWAEYDATWVAFDHVTQAFNSTSLFLVVALICSLVVRVLLTMRKGVPTPDACAPSPAEQPREGLPSIDLGYEKATGESADVKNEGKG